MQKGKLHKLPFHAHYTLHIPTLLYSSQVFDTANFIDSLYTWSAFNTEGVGKIVGAAIAEIGKEIDVNGIHLIGKPFKLKFNGIVSFILSFFPHIFIPISTFWLC